MPTTKPRFTITLSPRVYAAVDAMCQGTGTSKSQFIENVLSENLPVLERLAALVQAAKRATPEGLKAIGERMKAIEKAAHKASGGMDMATDLFLGDLVGQGGSDGTAEASGPPLSNRGGQNSPTPQKTAPEPPPGNVVKLRRRSR